MVSGEREERERERESVCVCVYIYRQLFFLDFTKQNKTKQNRTEQKRKKMKDRNIVNWLPLTLVACLLVGKLYMCPIVLLGYFEANNKLVCHSVALPCT
jgi:hypothetical protein